MKKSFIVSAYSLLGFLLPFTTSAQATIAGAREGVTNLAGLVTAITTNLVAALGTLLLAAGVVAFFWGVVQYIWGVREGDGTKIKNGNQFMVWAVIALFVMFSVYGIIQVAQSLIPGLNATTIKIPRLDFQTGESQSPSGNKDPLTPQNSKYPCPDGVSYVTSPSDYDQCPSVKAAYVCPDGRPYYNLSDAKFCKNNTSAPSNTTQKTCGTDETLVDGICYSNTPTP